MITQVRNLVRSFFWRVFACSRGRHQRFMGLTKLGRDLGLQPPAFVRCPHCGVELDPILSSALSKGTGRNRNLV